MDCFGVRDVCNVTLRALRNIPACRSMTGKAIKKGEPVVYFDYLKVSELSGSVSTVYATGGRGNARLLSWDGDKEITFHVEDALISPASLAVLTAAQMVKRRVIRKEIGTLIDPITDIECKNFAEPNVITLPATFDKQAFMSWGIIKVDAENNDGTVTKTGVRIYTDDIEIIADTNTNPITYKAVIDSNELYVNGEYLKINNITDFQILVAETKGRTIYRHEKYTVTAVKDKEITLKHTPYKDINHPLFVFDIHEDGSMDLIGEIDKDVESPYEHTPVAPPDTPPTYLEAAAVTTINGNVVTNSDIYEGNDYIVDYYHEVKGNTTSLVITADGTSDYFKLEGETLWTREADGENVPVMITIPKVRPRSEFTITMSNSGDPSTFSFDFDVFASSDPTYSACDNKIMVIIDIIEDDEDNSCNCVYDSVNPKTSAEK